MERVEPRMVYIRITQQSACGDCHVKSVCTASEGKIRTIEVEDCTGRFRPNEEVLVCGRYAMGMKAVGLAFVVPMLLIVSALVAGTGWSGNELIGGLAGLSVLIPYYGCLYLMRDKLKRKFVFTLSKIK
ncbi:MAG: SoxR reducing system RseC family protein [Tannerella sp.]|nr:SoxR reducing system RseC family protein [Tannerella sp.]